ncbi:hypothetical protein EDB80DRAFT_676668 [Ilyonectria destructans]|nr:hypothetical protein EDB80DRAFT_676668 [Ilyonectria destructans]
MSRPDSPHSKIDLLLPKADKLQPTLSEIETFIDIKINPERRSTRSVFRDPTDLLNTVREEAQAIQFDAQAIVAQSHDASDTRSELVDASANEQDGNPSINLNPCSRIPNMRAVRTVEMEMQLHILTGRETGREITAIQQVYTTSSLFLPVEHLRNGVRLPDASRLMALCLQLNGVNEASILEAGGNLAIFNIVCS